MRNCIDLARSHLKWLWFWGDCLQYLLLKTHRSSFNATMFFFFFYKYFSFQVFNDFSCFILLLRLVSPAFWAELKTDKLVERSISFCFSSLVFAQFESLFVREDEKLAGKENVWWDCCACVREKSVSTIVLEAWSRTFKLIFWRQLMSFEIRICK